MLHRRIRGLLAAAALILLLLAPGVAEAIGPAGVTVRVEGASQTRVPEQFVTTTTTPVNKDGNPSHSCTGTSVAGALEIATGGDWNGPWFDGFGYSVHTIRGETYDFSTPDFWSLAVNNRESNTGACQTELQQGDEVLFFVARCEVGPPPDFACQNEAVRPLGLFDVPNSANRGEPFTVRVVRYDAGGNPSPVPGATVAGGGVSATTDSNGRATLSLQSTGTFALQASKPGSARSATREVCVHEGNDGRCGTRAPETAAPEAPTTPSPPQTRPTYRDPDPSHVLNIVRRQRFAAGRGPRRIRGRVVIGTAGLRQVKLRLSRRAGRRCEYYSGRLEDFRPTSCGRAWWFRIGDRAEWSYLLPARLGPGRYLLEVAASDRNHVRDTYSLVFVVERERS